MRNIILIWIFITLFCSCEKDKISGIQSKYFLKHYDIDYLEDTGRDLDSTPDGGYIVIGTSQNKDLNNGKDIVLMKVDKFGNQPSWSPVIIGGQGDDYGKTVISTENGYIIAGSMNGMMALKKIGSDGQEIWSTSYVNAGTLEDIAIADDKIYVAGSTGYPDRKPFRAVFDNSGLLLDGSSPAFSQTGDYFTSLAQAGAVTSCFGSEFRNGQWDIFLIEHGAQGSWSTEETVFNEPQNEESSRIISSSSGGFFIVGTIKFTGTGSSQIFIRKLNPDYSVNNAFDHSHIDQVQNKPGVGFRGMDICEMQNGIVAVLADRTASNDVNMILFLLASDGTLISEKVFGSSGDQTAAAIKTTPDNGLIILGSNEYQGNSMITLIKTDSEGEIWE